MSSSVKRAVCPPNSESIESYESHGPNSDAGRKRHRAEPAVSRSASCSGHIMSIELIDFMCHRHLLVHLNPHINFVVGNNGSGKSAILTALTVCLGGRASSTQRASSVDTLIREGATSGKVKIKLYNGGNNPFQPQIYGANIVIERSFKREGSSSYGVFDENAKLIAVKREEINVICDHFGIQVDNPLAVLTQETAKKFLANAKPKDLYEFFMKATQLEQLSIDYAFALDKIKESRLRLESSRRGLEPLRHKISDLEGQLKNLERLKQAFQNIQQLRKELTWAMIKQRETEYQSLVDSADARKERIEGLQTNISDLSTCHEKTLSQICTLENELSAQQKGSEPLLLERKGATDQIKNLEKTISELQQDAKEINREFAALRVQIEEMTAKIAEEAKGASSNRFASLKARLAEIEREEQTLSLTIRDDRQAEESMGHQVSKAGEKAEKASSENVEVETTIKRVQQQINDCRSFKRDRIRAFGENMGSALADIKKNSSHFGHMPVGPAALHIRVREEKWTLALEAVMQSNVEAFIVNDHSDRAILQKILQRHGLTNPVVVLRYDGELDTSSGLPSSSFVTAMDMLEISSPIVKKMLIILSNIESNVLIEDRQEAMQVMRQRPRNVHAIYTPTARLNAGARSVSVTQLYINPNRPHFLQNPDHALKDLEVRLAELEQKRRVLSRDLSNLKKAHEKANSQLAVKREAAEKSERDLRQLKNEARQIQEELRAEESVSYSLFEQERSENEEKMEALTVQFQANAEKLQELQHERDRLRSCISSLDERITAFRQAQEAFMEDISDSIKSRGHIEKEIEKTRKILLSETSALEGAEEDCRRAREALDAMVVSAEKICPRMVTSRSILDLDRELSAQEECLRSNSESNVDPVALKKKLEETRNNLKESEKSIIVNEKLIKTLSSSLEERQRAWEDFRRSVSKMSSTEFIFMLTARGFQGSLEYRHHEAELHIKVIPQGQLKDCPINRNAPRAVATTASKVEPSVDGENRDVRQLSGGEKSYSTACFLFSLWQAMGSPLRCLDEFDVYMDPVNRNYVLELLVAHARASKVQFILITPSAIPDGHREASDVRIHRLRDPERGQGVLTAPRV